MLIDRLTDEDVSISSAICVQAILALCPWMSRLDYIAYRNYHDEGHAIANESRELDYENWKFL